MKIDQVNTLQMKAYIKRKENLRMRFILSLVLVLPYSLLGFIIYYMYDSYPGIWPMFTTHYFISLVCTGLYVGLVHGENMYLIKYSKYITFSVSLAFIVGFILKEILEVVISKLILIHIALIGGLMFINFFLVILVKLIINYISFLRVRCNLDIVKSPTTKKL